MWWCPGKRQIFGKIAVFWQRWRILAHDTGQAKELIGLGPAMTTVAHCSDHAFCCPFILVLVLLCLCFFVTIKTVFV